MAKRVRTDRRNAAGRFSRTGRHFWRGGRKLSKRESDAYLRRLKREAPKKPRRKPKPPPVPRPPIQKPGDTPERAFPREYTSPFRKFLMTVRTGGASRQVDVYALVVRTRARYKTVANPSGRRIIPVNMGMMTLGQARSLTVADVIDTGAKFDKGGVLGIYQMIGKPKTKTGPKGDPKRRRAAKKYL